jgi:damage-control phosphatase, subfamily III
MANYPRQYYLPAPAPAPLTVAQTGAIDDVHRAVSALDLSEHDKAEEGKIITQGLAKLKYELQHNRRLL